MYNSRTMYDSSTLYNSTPIYNSTTMFNSSTKYKVQSTVLRQIARIGLDGARWAINRPSGNHRKLLEIIGHCWKPQFPFSMKDWSRATGSTPAERFFSSCSGQRDEQRESEPTWYLDTWTLGQSGTPIFLLKGQFNLEDTETETETQANLNEIKCHPH